MIKRMQDGQNSNPYQFITEANHQPNKPKLNLGNSKKSRIIIVVSGVFTLFILIAIVSSIISSASNAGRENFLLAAQKQSELIRVSKIGIERSNDAAAKNLASSVNISIQSDQAALIATLKASGIGINNKQLALGKNQKTDETLTAAEQSNRFDDVFIQVIQAQLVEYQKVLDKAHQSTDSPSLRQALEAQYTAAGLLATAKQ